MIRVIILLNILFSSIVSYSQNTKEDLSKQLSKRLKTSNFNLIPDQPGLTPNYWCTWSAQNFAVDSFSLSRSIGLGDHSVFSDNLTEEAVFKNPNWQNYIPKGIRKDLFIVFDVGWDISGGAKTDKSKWILGTLNVASDKFPDCTGLPSEKLRKLNELAKSAGWKGAGLWVAAQSEMDSRGNRSVSDQEVESYFRKRAKWSKEAGIKYWKVDYGSRAGSNEFRRMLTRVAAEEAPDLWVEHGRSGGPLNDEECPWDTKNFYRKGSYRTWDNGAILNKAVSLLQFSDVLRTYDVTAQLSIPTTIDRVAQIFSEVKDPKGKAIINCEDEVYVAAALGCAMGVMRHPLFINVKGYNYNPLHVEKLIDEVVRAVRWQRIAPAFGAGETNVSLDSNFLKDTWHFQQGDSWAAWMNGKTSIQGAPAIVARGIKPPVVEKSKDLPYVLASRHPNGAVTIATLKRTDSARGFYYPLADITINSDTASRIGIFGRYKSITFITKEGRAKPKLFAQDLAGDRAIEITDLATFSGSKIKISGSLLKQLGSMEGTKGDFSEPALFLYIQLPEKKTVKSDENLRPEQWRLKKQQKS